MRRAIRIDRSVDLLRPRVAAASKPSPYLCSSCTYQSSSFSTSASRPADKKIPFTEKVRRKIWGTDQPPGLENPYGDSSVFDRTKERAREQRAAEKEAEQEARKATQLTMADVDPSYVPATNWEGLERVGGFGNWWKENWDPEHQFEGFLPRKVAKDTEAITAALHRAMVEVFALREAGIPLSEVSKTISTWDPTKFVQVLPSLNGASLQFPPKASLDQVIQSLTLAAAETDETAVKGNPSESEANVAADRSTVDPLHPTPEVEEIDETAVKGNPSESEADVAADRSTVDPLHPRGPTTVIVDETAVKGNPSESEADVAADRSTVDPLNKGPAGGNKSASTKFAGASESWDAAWLEVSLADPEVKFAVVKRTMQLTGIRIPDPEIRASNTAQALLRNLITPPKPTKVVEALNQSPELAELPNISIYGKRRTPVDKERSVGRWKVIEKELRERGLPVFGKEELNSMRMPLFGRNR